MQQIQREHEERVNRRNKKNGKLSDFADRKTKEDELFSGARAQLKEKYLEEWRN